MSTPPPTDPPGSNPDGHVAVVIPVHNEAAILTRQLEALAAFFDRLLGEGRWHFILVENGSEDATPDLVDAATLRWQGSRSLELAEPNVGAAMKEGLRSSTAEWIFLIDIEQWDLDFLSWAWRNRAAYDLFLGSKRADPTLNGQSGGRRLLSWGLNSLLQLTLGFTGTDTHGPKLLNRVALDGLIQQCRLDRGQFDTELVLRALRARKRIVEAPVPYRELRPSRNTLLLKIAWNLGAFARLLWVMRRVPAHGSLRLYRVSREDVLAGEPAIARSAP